MATDKLSVDLLLNTRKAERELAKLNKEFAKLGKTMGGAFGGPGKGGDKVRALGTGLSKATVKADEFTKSLEASNARVVAFGASAGIIMQIDRAFKGLVTSTMKVEKALLDVNVVLNASTKQLRVFGAEMFKIARGTAQSFEVVAEATTELARQGLGTEKTLKRTNDALILTRLTGMAAADSVKSLTAAVNSFNKEGVTSAQVINRMAKVDAAFAVSSEDLAKSISRVGASAVSAGVSMNELMAITTAVQQKTARGGAVIGNAFKTIFTRIQRTDVLQKLRNIGVAVTDMNGNMLSGMQVIQNLANNFDKLSKSQQASVSESVAGVFQVNILKAAMSDLSSATSHYKGALNAANSATDEAYKRNEQLNQSLDALANRTLANLTQAGAALGGGMLEPAIKRVLNIVNTSMESFGKGGAMEGFGQTWGKGIMKGLGDFIAGPGLVIVVATIGKLFYNLTKFTGKAFADIMGINKAAQQRVTIEGAIVDTLSKEPALLSSILSGDTKILTVEQQILATIRKQNIERQAMQIMAAPIAASMMGKGLHVGRSGGMSFKGGGRAGGFVPNFANAGSERAAAAAGGYTAGAIRTMHQPGAGTMMYNSAESVKRFPGMSQSAIMPPQGSPAGAGFRSAFGAAHGFDPYAGSGFVPNFAFTPYTKLGTGKKQQMPTKKEHFQAIGLSKAGKGAEQRQLHTDFLKAGGHLTVKNNALAMLIPKLGYQKLKHTGKGVGKNKNWTATFPSLGYSQSWADKAEHDPPENIVDQMVEAAAEVAANVSINLDPPGTNWTPETFEKAIRGTLEKGHKGKGIKGAMGAMTSAAGAAFETAVLAAMHLSADDPENKTALAPGGVGFKPADWDVFNPNAEVRSLFGGGRIKWKKGDLKITDKETPVDSMIGKLLNDLLYGGARGGELMYKSNLEAKGGSAMMPLTPGDKLAFERKPSSARPGYQNMLATKRRRYGGGGGAGGYVPNFASALSSAIGREMQAGIPASAIRVGSSPALRSAGNPGGVGVFNTRHEPGGLQQGISRARAQGVSPKSHGVPNYANGGGPVFPDYSEKRPWKLRELAKEKAASDALTAAKNKEAAATAHSTRVMAAATKKTGLFGRSMTKLRAGMQGKGTGIGMGVGLIVPSIVNTFTQDSEAGSTGARAGAAMSQAAMWGGTGLMIHPAVGALAALGGGIWGYISAGVDETVKSLEKLSDRLNEVSQREDRTAETFARIAQEMDKITEKSFGPNISKGLQAQRNKLTDYLTEEYGVVKVGDSEKTIPERLQKTFDKIGKTSTGEGLREVGEEVRKRGDSLKKAAQLDILIKKSGEKIIKGVSTLDPRYIGIGAQGTAPSRAPWKGIPPQYLGAGKVGEGDFTRAETQFIPLDSEAFRKRKRVVIDRDVEAYDAAVKRREETRRRGHEYNLMVPKEFDEYARASREEAAYLKAEESGQFVANPETRAARKENVAALKAVWERRKVMAKREKKRLKQADAEVERLKGAAFEDDKKKPLLKVGMPWQVGSWEEGDGILRKGSASATEGRSLKGAAGLLMSPKGRVSNLSLMEEIFFGKATKGTATVAGREIETNIFDKNAARDALAKRQKGLEAIYDITGGVRYRTTTMGEPTKKGEVLTPSPKERKALNARLVGEMVRFAGVDKEDQAQVSKALMRQAKDIAKSRRESRIEGTENITTQDILREAVHEMLNKPFTELDDLYAQHKGAEENRVKLIEEEILAYQKSLVLFREQTKLLIEFGSSLRLASLEAKHNVNVAKQADAFTKQKFSITQRRGLSAATSVMDPFGLTEVRKTQALQVAGRDNMAARAAAGRQAQFGAGEAGRKVLQEAIKDITKDLLEGETGMAIGPLVERREALEGMGLRELGGQGVDELRATLAAQKKTLADIEGKAGLHGSKKALQLEQSEQTQLKALQKTVPAIEGIIRGYDNAIDLADKKLTQQEVLANMSEAAQREEINNRMKFNEKMRDFNQLLAYVLAQQEGADATGLAKTGRISGQTMVGRYKNAVETRRNRFGVGNMDKEAGESFRLGFKGAMTYNARSYLDELEDGSRQVATTMKTSFADAFKSIASGASSAQEAMAQFAGNILNTISDMSAQMATNMLFSRMGFPTKAKGGYIPRYGGGGVVTGGSGTKDDVFSVMNAGEYVIKKSSAKKIGYDTLNAINSGGVGGFAEGGAQAGGGNMGKMFAVSAAASAASGLVSGQWGKSKKKPWRGQDYGHGRGEYGYFGGPDSDAGGRDSIAGGGRGAQVSLNKAYVYYRRDPKTGKLVSERVRPTEGRYEVSGALSLLGRLNADDRQTGRMFGKEQKMGAYSDYLFGETKRQRDVMKAHKKQKKDRLISAYMNAAMLIGGSYMMGKTRAPLGPDVVGPDGMSYEAFRGSGGEAYRQKWGDFPVTGRPNQFPQHAPMPPLPPGVDPWSSKPKQQHGGSAKGSPALLTAGEYVMGADTVRQYGLDFMGELNRGNVPGMAAGGPVSRGNQGTIAGMVSGGETNNNVNISINVDKRGNVEAKAAQGPNTEDNASRENSVRDAENNKELGKALQSVVLQELIRQQRPGGLLQKGPNTP